MKWRTMLRMILYVGISLCVLCDRTARAAERLVGLQSAPSVAMALPWFAEEARLYAKHDLDFQLVYIASSGIVTAAMSGGSGNVAIVGGEGPIRAYISGNTDFVFIGSVKNVLTHSLMGKPEIKRPEDLKGKRIGVGRIGGNSHYFTMYGMRQKGLDPLKDANLIQTGGAPETFLALSTGAVDAASLTTPQDTRAAFQGFNYVIDGREIRPAYVATGFVTLRSVIAKRPKAVSQFMHVMAESLKIMISDRELAFQSDQQKNRSDRPQSLRRGLHGRVESPGAETGYQGRRHPSQPRRDRAHRPAGKTSKSRAVDRSPFSRRDGEGRDV